MNYIFDGFSCLRRRGDLGSLERNKAAHGETQIVRANWPDRFFAKIIDSFLTKTRHNGAEMGKAMTQILRASEVLDFALPFLKVAADPGAADCL